MLTKKLVSFYLTAFINLLFLTTTGILLNVIFISKQLILHGIKQIVFQFLFLNTLMYIFFIFIFVLILHEYKINMIIKALVMGAFSVLFLVFLTYAVSGLIPVNDLEYVIELLIMFSLGFILPYSQQKILEFIL